MTAMRRGGEAVAIDAATTGAIERRAVRDAMRSAMRQTAGLFVRCDKLWLLFCRDTEGASATGLKQPGGTRRKLTRRDKPSR